VTHIGRQEDFSLQRWSSTERKLHRLAGTQFSRRVAGRTPSNQYVNTGKGALHCGTDFWYEQSPIFWNFSDHTMWYDFYSCFFLM
jgi:hypothetical protein